MLFLSNLSLLWLSSKKKPTIFSKINMSNKTVLYINTPNTRINYSLTKTFCTDVNFFKINILNSLFSHEASIVIFKACLLYTYKFHFISLLKGVKCFDAANTYVSGKSFFFKNLIKYI
jgi:hypothetical protein